MYSMSCKSPAHPSPTAAWPVAHHHFVQAPLLRVDSLSVVLDGREVVRDVSFEIDCGETVAITGPNGSGKSVLLKAILGILPHRGTIRWSHPTSIGYVPQRIDADRSVPLTVRNLLEAKARVIGRGKSEIAAVTDRAGLSAAALSAQIGSLSGGQFQRALIAFAILGNPELLLFDEPTASLDEPGEEDIDALLDELRREHGIAVIVVSHDFDFVSRYAKRVLSLDRVVVGYGAPRDVLMQHHHHHEQTR